MNEPKILISSPIYDKKDYCIKKHLKCIKEIDYNNYEHIIVDNSETEKFYKELKSMGVNAYHVDRGGNSRQGINNSMNFIREYFMKGDYDYMFVVETDLFPDKNIIKRLLNHKKAVVGSYYLLGFEKDDKAFEIYTHLFKIGDINRDVWMECIEGLQFQRACIFKLDRKDNGNLGTKNISKEESHEYFRTGLRQIHGCGLGATLIRRDIIGRFPFWTDSRFNNKHHDVYFYMDLHNAGEKVYVDTDVLIKHQPSRWHDVEDW